jgi:hypothetical protein
MLSKCFGPIFVVMTALSVAISGCARPEPLVERQKIILAEEIPPEESPYLQDYDFTNDWFLQVVPVWEKAMEPFKGKPDIQYLEVGMYEGRSVVWMLENVLTHPTARVTGIDLFWDPTEFSPELKERFLANIKRAGGEDKTKTIVGFSQEELRKLPLDTYDIIYIDGSHMGPDVLEDAVLAYRLLKDGGMIIFDDYWWHTDDPMFQGSEDSDLRGPQLAINVFIKFFGENFRIIHWVNQVILVKEKN